MSKAISTLGIRAGRFASVQKNNVLKQIMAVNNQYAFLGIDPAFILRIVTSEYELLIVCRSEILGQLGLTKN